MNNQKTDELPLWKRMAMERGITEQPSAPAPVPDKKDGKGKKKDKEKTSVVETQSVRLRVSTLRLLEDYDTIVRFREGRRSATYAENIDYLVKAALEPYQDLIKKLKG